MNATLKKFFRALGYIPVLFVFALIGWSYYAFLFGSLFLLTSDAQIQIFLIILYNIITILFIYSNLKVVLAPHAYPNRDILDRLDPNSNNNRNEINDTYAAAHIVEITSLVSINQYLNPYSAVATSDVHEANESASIQQLQVKRNGHVRFCRKCNIIKPDRTHHCSACDKCILRFDHHCPWVGRCVSWTNHRYFVQFLIYAWCYVTFLFSCTIGLLIQAVLNTDATAPFNITFNHVMIVLLSGMFTVCLTAFASFHLYLLCINKTTLEVETRPRVKQGGRVTRLPKSTNPYDLGWKKNVESIMGPNPFYWLLPITIPEHYMQDTSYGHYFPVNQNRMGQFMDQPPS